MELDNLSSDEYRDFILQMIMLQDIDEAWGHVSNEDAEYYRKHVEPNFDKWAEQVFEEYAHKLILERYKRVFKAAAYIKRGILERDWDEGERLANLEVSGIHDEDVIEFLMSTIPAHGKPDEDFIKFLKDTKREVDSWPAWKKIW